MTETPSESPKKRTRYDIAFTWLMFALIPTVIATLISFAASLHPIAELSVHFKVLYWWSALFTFVGLYLLKHRRWSIVALVILLIHSVGIVPWYIPRSVEPPASVTPNLTLLTANVLTESTTPEALIEYIRAKDPDVIVLQEISSIWVGHLQPLIDSDYPYNRIEAQEDNFGMATLSKIPLDSVEVIDPSGIWIPVIESKFTVNGRAISLLNFHPLPPGTPNNARYRNIQLDFVPDYTKKQADLCIVAGDFNVTPWSPNYTAMIEDSGLYNTRKGFGLLLTWPTPPLIPIDHILASPAIHTLNMEIGPNNGSDHRPIFVELYIPPNTKP